MDTALVLPRIDPTLCTGCSDCVDACHAVALAIRDEKALIVRAADCDYCTECEAICPAGAITCPFEVVVGTSS